MSWMNTALSPEMFWAARGVWRLVTRLGEAQILLPAMLAALIWLARAAHARPAAIGWLFATGAAAVLTTATKVAFFGFEIGYAPLDYTGISGHAMFAAAVLPVLIMIAVSGLSERAQRLAVTAGYLLAAVIAYSRVRVGAHSVSEIVAGMALGSVASALVLRYGQFPQLRAPQWLAAGLLVWMIALPFGAPSSRTHDWVIRLSLALSERPVPYSRREMLREYRHEQQRQQSAGLAIPAVRHLN